MITEVCLIVLSVTVIVSVLVINLKLIQLEEKIDTVNAIKDSKVLRAMEDSLEELEDSIICLEDNILDNFGEIKKNMESLEMQELNTRDILMEQLSSNKENTVKEINNLYSKLVFTPMTFQYVEKERK